MRRSGNHAFINWLKNALEEEKISFYQPKNERNFLATPTGNTVFINQVNKISNKNYIKILLNHLIFIIKAKHIIISTEDFIKKNSNKIPECDHCFLVKRSILNLVASRYKKMLSKVEAGGMF